MLSLLLFVFFLVNNVIILNLCLIKSLQVTQFPPIKNFKILKLHQEREAVVSITRFITQCLSCFSGLEFKHKTNYYYFSFDFVFLSGNILLNERILISLLPLYNYCCGNSCTCTPSHNISNYIFVTSRSTWVGVFAVNMFQLFLLNFECVCICVCQIIFNNGF